MNALRASILLLCCLPPFAAATPDTISHPLSHTLSDPTRPSGTSASAQSGTSTGGWHLTATRITPAQRSAVINGSRVREGEEINGARVLHIRHAQVQLATPGGVTTLRLLPAEVKTIR